MMRGYNGGLVNDEQLMATEISRIGVCATRGRIAPHATIWEKVIYGCKLFREQLF